MDPGPEASVVDDGGGRRARPRRGRPVLATRRSRRRGRARAGAGPTIGGTTHLVLYRSSSAKGETVAVSGVVSTPAGDPPKGGWPVVSWGHGTTGMADRCAPSRSALDRLTGVYTASMDQVTAGLVEDGYAVVRTDYEGLGTPGPHPYLMGQSAGAAMADIVLAAHELTPDLSHE